jgi:hypothetical protein
MMMTDSGLDPSRFEWREQTAKYSRGQDLLISNITVGSVFYDGVSSRDINDRYKITTALPGVRPRVDRFASEDEGKRALERLTMAWFARTVPAIALSPTTQKGSDNA